VRFETRLNFHMEECTEKLAHQSIERKLLDQVSGERIRTELFQLVAQESPSIALQRLNELGLLSAVEADWQGDDLAPEYARLPTALAFAQTEPNFGEYFTNSTMLRFFLLFIHLTPAAAERLARRLRLSRHEITLAIACTALPELQRQLESPALPASEIAARLSRLPHPLILLLLTQSNSKILFDRIKHYLIKQRMQPALLTGEDLQHLELPSGPIYTRILRALRAAQLDGKVTTRTEAIAIALRMAKEEDLKMSNNQ
jgi:tRNA nucleotidyltransferase (CCA-adding enzyme)